MRAVVLVVFSRRFSNTVKLQMAHLRIATLEALLLSHGIAVPPPVPQPASASVASPEPSPPVISSSALIDFVSAALIASGSSAANASITARVLIEAELRGVTSHGVNRLYLYCREIESGAVNGRGVPFLVGSSSSSEGPCAVVDGDNASGCVVGSHCIEVAAARCKEFGIAIVVARNTNHFGIAGYYAHALAKQGLIGLAFTNTSPIVVPTHSKRSALGTNPIAFAAPCDHPPVAAAGSATSSLLPAPEVVFDAATSTVPFGRIEVYLRKNLTLPNEQWAVDGEGIPTRDPASVIGGDGGALPLGGAAEATGGHKGYGLALMVEMLCGVLACSKAGPSLGQSMNPRALEKSKGGELAQCFIAIDPSAFICASSDSGGSAEQPGYATRAAALVAQLRALPPLNAAQSVRVPGERAARETVRRKKEGIAIHPKIVASLREVATRLGVSLPPPLQE